LTMATVAEQWVLVEMVQALYEVGSTTRDAHAPTSRDELDGLFWPVVRGLGGADSFSPTRRLQCQLPG
jgi:hypothetical protein